MAYFNFASRYFSRSNDSLEAFLL